MGRLKLARNIIQTVLLLGAILIVTACENDLQTFIEDDLFGPPYRKEVAKLLPTNGSTTESFGAAVDIDGSYVIVGAPYGDGNGSDTGAAYIFTKNSNGTWSTGQRIIASDGVTGDSFGSAVAISGDWAVVGASRKHVNGLDDVGGVYIFHRETTGEWIQTQNTDIETLTGSNIGNYDNFGYSVDIDNSWIIIGARQDDLDQVSGDLNLGAAYVLRLNELTWNYSDRLDNGLSTLGFGFSVDIEGDLLVVGAPNEDTDGAGSAYKQGAAYIYRYMTDGWELSNRIEASVPIERAHLGGDVAISTQYTIVGAPSWEGVAGSASFFSRTSTDEWDTAEIQLITPEEQKVDDFYGKVATDGSFILIGAPHADYYSSLSGAVYLYEIGSTGNVTFLDTVAPKDISEIKGWGWSVAIDEGTAIIGATDPYNSEDGAAYIFE